MRVDREQALAFRRAGMHLHERTDDPLAAVGACGLQDSPPGWAAVALHARTRAEPPDGAVVQVNAMRRAPFLVPAADLPVFTTAMVPDDAAGLKAFVGAGSAKGVLEAGLEVREALELVAGATRDALASGPLGLDDLHQGLRERLPDALLPPCRGCDSHHVKSGFWRGMGTYGVTVMPGRSTWALADPPASDPDAARAELARRFLRTHGPATHTQLSDWAQCGPAHAKRLLALVDEEVEQVEVDGRRGWVLAEDLPRLEAPPAASGVRLLGGFDPYVAQPDREALVPDAALRRRMFPAIGRANVVLVDGRLAGLWKARKAGRRLDVEVEWLGGSEEADLTEELAEVARLRGAEQARLR